jgi:hypothetical protein
MRRIIVYLYGTWANPSKRVERGDGGEVHKPFKVMKLKSQQ